MAVVTMRELLEAGVHFGHRTRRWNPKMKSFIFTERNGIHIVDLQQTIPCLSAAYNVVRDCAGEGGTILFVGTKRQAKPALSQHADRCGMPYVSHRWLGGTLTNWRTIRQRVDRLIELENQREIGMFSQYTKREALGLERQIENLNLRFGGVKNMTVLPDLVFVVDVLREKLAVGEANKLGIPVVAIVDTNCDPTLVDHIIPANDDAIRSLRLIITKMADAVLEGKQQHKEVTTDAQEVSDEDLRYLGESTLAKIQSGSLEFDASEEYQVEYEQDSDVEDEGDSYDAELDSDEKYEETE